MRITRSVVKGAYNIDQGSNPRSDEVDALLAQESYECMGGISHQFDTVT